MFSVCRRIYTTLLVFYVISADKLFLCHLKYNQFIIISFVFRYFCEYDLNRTHHELEDLKEKITETAEKGPGGLESLTWPVGV